MLNLRFLSDLKSLIIEGSSLDAECPSPEQCLENSKLTLIFSLYIFADAARGKMAIKTRFCYFWFFLYFSLAFCLANLSAQERETHPPIEHTPHITFSHGEILEIRGSVKEEVEWMRFFFQYEEVEQFQARNMLRAENGFYVYEFDTSVLPCLEFEYYLAAKTVDKIIYYPLKAPTRLIRVRGESEEPLPELPEDIPLPEAEEKKFQLPFRVNGSFQSQIAEKESALDERERKADGNFGVTYSYRKQGNLNIDVDSNFSYTNNPLPEENKLDLSNMILTLSKDNHLLRAGDINLNESEYTAFGYGRRGMEYTFNNQKAYFHLFNVSSQQIKGFNGFGIPKSDTSILGGAAGYSLFGNKIFFKAIYVGGKDDPSAGVNVGVSDFYTSREGSVIAFFEETRLFENKLNLKAEYARSKYDADLADDTSALPDYALALNASFFHDGITIGGIYRYVGKNFNSVGLQYFTNDRKGYEANMGLSKGIINLTGIYTFQQDNVKNDPAEYTSKDNCGTLNLSLALSEGVSLNLGYKRDKQRTYLGDSEAFFPEILTNEYSGALNLSLNQSGNINLTLINSTLSSENDPLNDSSTLTLNIGSAFRSGEIFNFNPVFSYSRTKHKFTNEESQTYNSFLTTELSVVPRVFSLFFSGGFNRVKLSPDNISNILNLEGALNLFLDRLLKIGSVVFSLKGTYNRSEFAGMTMSDYRIFLQCDFAF